MQATLVVGELIRRRRQDQGLTLRQLAERIGMTAGYLSRVENHHVTPSLDALEAIAGALATPVSYFLDSTPNEAVVRARDHYLLPFPEARLIYELLTPSATSQIMAILIRLQPGAHKVTPPLPLPNEQWMFVLEGRMAINVDGALHILDRHDAITFNGNLLREFSCAGDEETCVICAVSPPVLSLAQLTHFTRQA